MLKRVTKRVTKIVAFWCSLIVLIIILIGLFIVPVFFYFSRDLPDYNQLTTYDPPIISRLYSYDGELMSELAKERRIFKSIYEIPALVKNAFIAAEDQNYYSHPGIDLYSIVRAAIQNIMNIGNDKNPVGGSTITQQVVKNFLLTNERSISRKIKEAILAYRINTVYSKDRILELYLNQIYLGNSAYGVASAAMNYFSKDLKDLTIEEAALLAAMPKAPSSLDPTKHEERAKVRRNWVVDRMLEERFITQEEAERAKQTPITLTPRFESAITDNGYYTESVRLELIDMYGYDYVYQEGLTVHTNVNKKLQKYADDALRQGLIEYDRKHGWKGALDNKKFKGEEWKAILKSYEKPAAAGNWKLAAVLKISFDNAIIGFDNGNKGVIPLNKVLWARQRIEGGYVGKKVERINDVLKSGDIILVSQAESQNIYNLEQIPEVNGALVAIEPRTGKVLAMTGGYSFKDSKYNRATQALRQPGSSFKPFVYLAALEAGYSPTTLVKDEQIFISQGPGLPVWAPKNLKGDYLGTITLRKALEKSRNLATVRLIATIGLEPVIDMATRFGVYKDPPKIYSMALGAYETTLMNLTAAYATFANGGIQVKPKFISHIIDRKGNLIYNFDSSECLGCQVDQQTAGDFQEENYPRISITGNYLVDPMTNYQLLSMLEGVVQRGTGTRAKQVGKVVAGKTGTSNDSKDVWFVGFSPDLVCGVFVGFDTPKTLGQKEQGASLALPIFVNFMKNALQDMPNKEFSIPEGISFVEVDINTGQKAGVFAGNNMVLEPVKPQELEKILNLEMSELPENEVEIKIDDVENAGVY